MEAWLDTAQGPLFALTFLIMVTGLLRHVLIQAWLLLSRRDRLRRVGWRAILRDAAGWTVPVRHLVRGTVLLTAASFLFHVGAILVPLLLADHVVRWERLLGVDLPQLGKGAADVLTLATIACATVLGVSRFVVPRIRALSRWGDHVVLAIVVAPFVSGFLAAHPALNPLPWTAMMLIHVLSAEVLLVAVPFTKLAHVVLFFFDRVSQIHWHLQPGAGDLVARALYGKEAHV